MKYQGGKQWVNENTPRGTRGYEGMAGKIINIREQIVCSLFPISLKVFFYLKNCAVGKYYKNSSTSSFSSPSSFWKDFFLWIQLTLLKNIIFVISIILKSFWFISYVKKITENSFFSFGIFMEICLSCTCSRQSCRNRLTLGNLQVTDTK